MSRAGSAGPLCLARLNGAMVALRFFFRVTLKRPRGGRMYPAAAAAHRVVGIFPNEASIIRLVGAALMEQNEECQLQHRYLSLEPLADCGLPAEEDQMLLVPPAAAPILTPRSA